MFGDIVREQPGNQSVGDDGSSSEFSDGIITTDAPHLAPKIPQRVQIENTLADGPPEIPWPEISTNPINEFTTAGYIAMAFPTLFPTGKADLCSPGTVKVSPSEYFQYLMKYKDFSPSEYFQHLMKYKDDRFSKKSPISVLCYEQFEQMVLSSKRQNMY
uniref:Uncharacterized protein n=1 Tax=Cacopsylla melanoneura TaxID=428564 RepID=A0A8D9B0H4_9HEMI